MRLRIVLGAVALFLAWLYAEALVLTIGVASAQAPPVWWIHIFPTHVSAVVTWIVTSHTAAIVIVALPFAFVIARLYGRIGVLLALGLTIGLYVIDPLPAVLANFVQSSSHSKVITVFDTVKLLGVLPGLVWIFSRPTSDNRFNRGSRLR
jgi:hypothetical protein